MITCQIFIEQRKGGTVWVPHKTLIADRIGNQVIIGNQTQHGSTGDRFATAGSAAEAAQQRAWRMIQDKYPGAHRKDVAWHVVSEDVNGFVAV